MNDLTLLIDGFRVVLVPTGGAYGRNDCLTTTEPLVQFWSRTSPNNIYPISYYDLDTLLNGWMDKKQGDGKGLCLDGATNIGVSGTGMDTVRAWLRGYVADPNQTYNEPRTEDTHE